MAQFHIADAIVRKNEGGYSDRAADKGGETYCGISRRWHPRWPGWKIVDHYKPLEQGEIIHDAVLHGMVGDFYKAEFWDKIKADEINSQKVATFVYDWMVTSWDDAVKALQKCAGVKQDGVIGKVTISSVNARDEAELMKKLITERKAFYNSLAKNDPSQKANLKGWLNRVDSFA